MELDLDAARAARAETNSGEKKTLKFGGKKFDLPMELPHEVAELWAVSDWRGAIVALLDGAADKFMAAKPSMSDLKELDEGLARLYGFANAGESAASSGS